MKTNHFLALLLPVLMASEASAQITAPHYSACVGTTLALSDPTLGGGWSSDNPSVATVNMITGLLTAVAPGTVNIHYLSDTRTFTIVGFSVLTPASACAGDTITLTLNPAIVSDRDFSPANDYGGYFSSLGVPYNWDTIMTGFTYLIKPYWIHPGGADSIIVITDTVSDTGKVFSSGWDISGLATCEVQAVYFFPLPASITGLSSVCSGDSITLSDATPGGTWASGSTSIATIGSTGQVHGIATGTATITYTAPYGCFITTSVTVNTLPSVPGSITGSFNMCAGLSTLLSDTTSGGTWSSGSTGIATVDTAGLVYGLSYGTAMISYGVTNSCGAVYSSISIFVDTPLAPPSAIIGASSVIVGSNTTLSDATPGGTWSSSATGIATVSTGGIVHGVSAGVATISYSLSNICGTVETTKTVNVLSATTITHQAKTGYNVEIFPNPTPGDINIKWYGQEKGEMKVRVLNMTGVEVFMSHVEINTAEGQCKIHLPEISAGLYLVSVETNKEIFISKLFVQK